MKENVRSVLCVVFTSLIVFAFGGCKKDANVSAVNIVGTWAKATTGDLQKYQFKNDSTFIFLGFAIDAATSKVLGYHYKSIGKYHVKGKELTFYQIVNYSIPNGYGAESELVEVGNFAQFVIYNADVTDGKLILNFICPSYADCVASPMVYLKE